VIDRQQPGGQPNSQLAGQQSSGVVAGPTVSFGFNLGKVPDHGEDSDPILREGPDLALAAVFDGMGGAGGTVYETPDGPRSGAYMASRIARDVVEEHMLGLLSPQRPLAGDAAATELQTALETALRDALTNLKAPASRLRSKLLRALPTTMALGALQRTEEGGSDWACHVLWAGDSRVYVFTPDGMHQLSIDDLRDPGDAMANLQHDSVISNAISADTEFHINHRRVTLTAPFFLLCATDGCFGYVRTPMHFEELVLRTLSAAGSDEEWSAALQSEIAKVTGDDAAMATIGVGADLVELQGLFAARLAEVTEQYTKPLDASLEQLRRAEEALSAQQRERDEDLAARWRRYKGGYERHLQDDPESDAEVDNARVERPIWNPAKRISTGSVTDLTSVNAAGAPAEADGPNADQGAPDPVEPDTSGAARDAGAAVPAHQGESW
jgi:serine/threonine protein phosphatase PrpC